METEDRTFTPDNVVGWRHEAIGPDDCRYLERWVIGFGPGRFWERAREGSRPARFSLRLHHFFRSDEDHLHDHPFWFVTIGLRGSYEDWVECWCVTSGAVRSGGPWLNCPKCGGTGQRIGNRMTPGRIRFRPALHRHRVVTDGCWTLVLSGPKVRDWGFWVDGKWMRQRVYFRRFGGRAACD